jgi:hypothetical protein
MEGSDLSLISGSISLFAWGDFGIRETWIVYLVSVPIFEPGTSPNAKQEYNSLDL